MRARHQTLAVLAVALAGSGALVLPGAALATVTSPSLMPGSVTVGLSTVELVQMDAAEADREFVLWLAQHDLRAMVRSTAWNAIFGDDAAIRRFFASEYDDAVRLAAETRARNSDFVAWGLATCVPAYAPEVCKAARLASSGDDAALEAFVVSGYAAAKERDQQLRDAASEQAAAIVKEDRVFVATLRDNDPGAQVRAAAGWALRDSATESDLVEFFSHGWGFAAGLDLQAHRTGLADREVAWRQTIHRLVGAAQAAEDAARVAEGEAVAQAREAAGRSWSAVREHASPATVAWGDAQLVASAQAATWRRVAQSAASASSPNWEPVVAVAEGMQGEWTVEQQQTAAQATYWTDLYELALAGELAWQVSSAS